MTWCWASPCRSIWGASSTILWGGVEGTGGGGGPRAVSVMKVEFMVKKVEFWVMKVDVMVMKVDVVVMYVKV